MDASRVSIRDCVTAMDGVKYLNNFFNFFFFCLILCLSLYAISL